MSTTRWLASTLAAGLLLASCAGMQSDVAPPRKALAPTGKLRVAFVPVLILATKDAASGQFKGVAIDLGNDLARRIGVPFEAVAYAGFPALIKSASSGEWDVAFSNVNPERAAAMDLSSAFMEVEVGYLVRAGFAATNVADVDKPGVRIGVIEKAPADVYLSGQIRNATLARVTTPDELYAMLAAGKADAIATGKTGLYAAAAKAPGSRVLDGRLFVDPIALGLPKGRDPAARAYLERFVEDAKRSGLVKASLEKAGLRGVVVAPTK